MRGAHVQEAKQTAVRPSWRNSGYSAAFTGITGLPNPDALRQGAHPSYAAALDTRQPHRLWRSSGDGRNTMLKSDSAAHVLRAAGRWLHRPGGREFVLLTGTVKNPHMAFDVDALLAEQGSNKRLGEAPKIKSLPGYIWYLWSSRGTRSGTPLSGVRATGIRCDPCGWGFTIPQGSDMTHSY